jgi:hypothetical protein
MAASTRASATRATAPRLVAADYATPDLRPTEGTSLDGALSTILAQPFGRFLLAVALGFLAFSLFAILQARYHPM